MIFWPIQLFSLNPNQKLPEARPLEILDGFFEVAKVQNWFQVSEILRLQEKYSRIKAELKKIPKKLPDKKITGVRPLEMRLVEPLEFQKKSFSLRQEKILEFLKEKGQAQVWQVKQIFPEVTKRTLRRVLRDY